MTDSIGEANTGSLTHYANFASRYVSARNVDVWCPPGYGLHPNKRYSVLYMHDGQNLFDAQVAFGGET